MSNPYVTKLPSAFWRRAVSGVPPFALDPMIAAQFCVNPTDKIATAGSCFAQNIARSLQASGMQYYVVEEAPPGMDIVDAAAHNYGTFSARFGNIYTVRQLVQLFDRAYGDFDPAVVPWQDKTGAFVDPFRPQIQKHGYDTIEGMLEDRARHLLAVRKMFESLSVLIFTLGLTESWQHDADGAIVPLAPGIVGGRSQFGAFSFVNFNSATVLADVQAFHSRLRHVNPAAKMILTVSPVPLIATYEDRHVLVSTTYSKSVLHAAAVESSQSLADVSYFPSYEIITSPINRDRYFDNDLRSVNSVGVDHVMRVFFRHYVKQKIPTANFELQFKRDIASATQVICDEEIIDL